MPVLHMETDAVRATGQQINQASESLHQHVQQLRSRTQQLTIEWQGPSSTMFEQEMQVLLQHAQQTAEVGTILHKRIEKEVDEWERVAQGLDPSIISSVVGIASKIVDNYINLDKQAILNKKFEDFKNNQEPYTATIVGYPRDSKEKWAAQQMGLYREDITDLEADLLDELRGTLGLDLRNIVKMQDIHDEAFAIEEQYFGANSNNDGIGDAFRHAYWSARLAREFGDDWATRFTDAHESKPNNQPARDFMDRTNNYLGIQIAKENPQASPRELANLIAEAIRNGKGVYIPGADQYAIDSPERFELANNGPLAHTNQEPSSKDIPNLPHGAEGTSSKK